MSFTQAEGDTYVALTGVEIAMVALLILSIWAGASSGVILTFFFVGVSCHAGRFVMRQGVQDRSNVVR